MSGFGSNYQYLLFLWITFDFESIYSLFEQGFDEEKKFYEWIAVKNQCLNSKRSSQDNGPKLIHIS